MLAFILAHETFFATLGGLLINEFIANAAFIKSNSLGQAAVAWAQARLSALEAPAAPKQ